MDCRKKSLPRRRLAALLACLIALPAVGCGHQFMGQVPVRGTSQRLVVGHNMNPTKRVWVLENGRLEKVRIVKGVDR